MNKEAIKGVVFDWGGVLIDDPEPAMNAYCALTMGVSVEDFDEARRKYNLDIQRGSISAIKFLSNISNDLNVANPKNISSLWYESFKNAYAPKKEMFTLISNLKRRGYKIGFLSNTEAPAVKFFREQKYERLFDATVFSCVEGIAKPDKMIYDILLQKIQLAAHEAIFIDDKQLYVEAAINRGMHGILFENPRQVKQALHSLAVKGV